MAVNWFASLKDVPWSKVIGMLPTIAESGRKIWDRPSTKSPSEDQAETTLDLAQLPASAAIAAIDIRIAALEKKAAGLREEAVSSFEVVRAIVEQNAQVVHAVDVLLVRTNLLVRVSILLGIVCAALLVLVLSR